MVRVKVLSLVVAASMAVGAASADQRKQMPGSEQDVVQASTLKRTHIVAPAWPESAAGVEGWVMLWFTVQPDGTVSDIEVKESHPESVFDASATEALRQWKYEPVERDGKKIAQRAEIRVKYALPNKERESAPAQN